MTTLAGGRIPVDRSTPPKTAGYRPFHLAHFDRESAGALEIITLQRPDLPIISMSLLALGAGGEQQPLGQMGLASIAASALTEGTVSSSAVEFAERAESLGGFVSSGADWEAAVVHAGSLSAHLEETFGLTAEAFLEAAFRSEDVERLRSRRLSEIARRDAEPSSIASRELLQRIYGQNSRYGTPLIGNQSSLGSIAPESVAGFWREHSQQRACLIVAGEVDPEEIGRLAEKTLGVLSKKPPETIAMPSFEMSPGRGANSSNAQGTEGLQIHLIDRPGGAQTYLIMGHPGPGRVHPDRPILRLLNAVFGGKFSSRINLNLREKHGYTYGASSSFSSRRGPGPFVIQSAVENNSVGEATRQVLLELQRIRTEPVSHTELESARSYLLGVQPYGFQTLEGWVSALGTLAVFDLPNDWFDQQQEALLSVQVNDVLEAANTHLQPEYLTLVAVGPAEQLAPQFGDLGPVEIHRV